MSHHIQLMCFHTCSSINSVWTKENKYIFLHFSPIPVAIHNNFLKQTKRSKHEDIQTGYLLLNHVGDLHHQDQLGKNYFDYSEKF